MDILLAGDGGQGVQTMAYIISESIFENKKFNISAIPNYGLEQRGGVSMLFLRVSKKEVSYPKFSKADLLCTLSYQAKKRTKEYIDKNTEVLNIFDFEEKIDKEEISKKSSNIFLLGILVNKFEKLGFLKSSDVFKKIEKKLKNKDNWDENKKAFKLGLNN